MVIASGVVAFPIVPPSLIFISSATVSNPALLNDIFSVAVSDAPVLKLNLVALLSAAKSPSDIAAIPAATKRESVPVPSSGAWKSICPITSSAAISVSPVCNVRTTGLLSLVPVCLICKPSLCTWVTFTSWSSPKLNTAPSESNVRSSATVTSPPEVIFPATATVELATVEFGVTVKCVT